MTNLQSAYTAFESNFNNLFALVRQRMEVEWQFHHRDDLQRLESDLLELLWEFAALLRVVYRYNLLHVLAREAVWYASALSARGSARDAFSLLLDSWIIAIQGLIKPPECNLLANPLQDLKANSTAIFSESAKRRGLPVSSEIENLITYLIAGDRAGAEDLLGTFVKERLKAYDLIPEFILPAMVEIGRRWEKNEIQIYEEHLASETIIRLLAGLHGSFRPHKTIHRLALVSCLPNDKHQLVPTALGTYLELRGWRVSSLGGSLPAAQITGAAKKLKPDALFFSLTMISRLIETLDLIPVLHRELPTSKIFIGGTGAQTAKSLLEQSGAIVIQNFETAYRLGIEGSSDRA
jgi:methanogenic corrinoid protein MtbC1